jgi:small subunit ribosomal protein S21
MPELSPSKFRDEVKSGALLGANPSIFLALCCFKNSQPQYDWLQPHGRVWRCIFLMAEVRVQEGEPLENALRRFKRKVQTEDIIKEVKRHSFYLKPGEKKRVKEALARKRNRKKVRKEQD